MYLCNWIFAYLKKRHRLNFKCVLFLVIPMYISLKYYICLFFSEATDITILDVLPWDDVLFKSIFPCLELTTLFQLRTVSQQFKSCIEGYFSCCRRVNLCRVSLRFTVDAFELLTYNNYSLRTLVLRNSKNWLSDPVLNPVLENNANLNKIDLTNCTSLSSTCLQCLAISCKNIQEILLRDCHWVSVEGLMIIAQNCLNLQKVDLSGCWEINDNAIITLARSCQKYIFLII